jgi:hypothetical protein
MAVRVRPIDPLNHGVPIVDAQGRPTAQFMRQWVQARNVNLVVGSVSVSLDDVLEVIADLQTAISGLNSLLSQLEAREIVAGTGLTGGGDLSQSRALHLANTAVTPGTYGSSTHVPQIAVDQQGRITAVLEVEIDTGGS